MAARILCRTIDWGSLPDWIAALGAVLIGVLAACIAFRQYRMQRYEPSVEAALYGDGRLDILIINKGQATGVITHIMVSEGEHKIEEGPVELPGALIDVSSRKPVGELQALAGGAALLLSRTVPNDIDVVTILIQHLGAPPRRYVARKCRDRRSPFSALPDVQTEA